jgi:hypothetical protein
MIPLVAAPPGQIRFAEPGKTREACARLNGFAVIDARFVNSQLSILHHLGIASPCFTPQSNQLSTTVPESRIPMPPHNGQSTANHQAQR